MIVISEELFSKVIIHQPKPRFHAYVCQAILLILCYIYMFYCIVFVLCCVHCKVLCGIAPAFSL